MTGYELTCWEDACRAIKSGDAAHGGMGSFPLALLWLADADSGCLRSGARRMKTAARLYFDYVLQYHHPRMKADLLSGVLLIRCGARIHGFYRLYHGGALMLSFEIGSRQAWYRVLPLDVPREGFQIAVRAAVSSACDTSFFVPGVDAFLCFDQTVEEVDRLLAPWIG